MLNPPTIGKILQERGEINDELDYALMNYLLQNRGLGFTACQPKLVELNDGSKSIKLDIDHTFLGNNNELLGLGIIGSIFVDYEKLEITYCTPIEELKQNIQKLKSAGVKPQSRPKGKY
ncbi:MAG: hypothetical protein ACTSV5_12200 [Promethearchaeota archaeon]